MIKTENKKLDSFWSKGLKPGGFIVIAARPGMGKTSFLLSIGNLISQYHKTQLISLKTSLSQLMQKRISDLILINDSTDFNLENLSKLILHNNLQVVLIDYLQLITDDRDNLIKELKSIAVKLNICMIVNSQISRKPEYRALSDRRPKISDLTTSGSIFNLDNIAYIDHLTFCYRDYYYNKDFKKPDEIELIQYDTGNLKVIQIDSRTL